jgi:hypothetical protein
MPYNSTSITLACMHSKVQTNVQTCNTEHPYGQTCNTEQTNRHVIQNKQIDTHG